MDQNHVSEAAKSAPRSTTRRYHHGNLRQALLDAAEAMLNEGDVSALTLRSAAARAGVSHAAPAHHFGSLKGLLTALAAVGMDRFAQALEHGHADGRRSHQAYVTFARDNPGLFKLMFDAARLDYKEPVFADANARARDALTTIASASLPHEADELEIATMRLALWARAHGYASLLLSGQLALFPVGDDQLGLLPAVMGMPIKDHGED